MLVKSGNVRRSFVHHYELSHCFSPGHRKLFLARYSNTGSRLAGIRRRPPPRFPVFSPSTNFWAGRPAVGAMGELCRRQEALQRLAAGETQMDVARSFTSRARSAGWLHQAPFGHGVVAQ
jgi:hypothetical protein